MLRGVAGLERKIPTAMVGLKGVLVPKWQVLVVVAELDRQVQEVMVVLGKVVGLEW